MTNKIANVVWKSAASRQRLKKLLTEIGAICVEESEGCSLHAVPIDQMDAVLATLKKAGFHPDLSKIS
jgi:hypothetical protein